MNVMSLNIRGLGCSGKTEWVRGLRVHHEVHFILIQETQFSSLDTVDIGRFWGRGDFSFEWVPSAGRSGGLLSIWDSKVFAVEDVQKYSNCLLVTGKVKGSGVSNHLLNVFVRIPWWRKGFFGQKLMGLLVMGMGYGRWQEFNCFIEKANLHEYSLKGRRYTFITGDKLSRIDRILVNWNFFSEWPAAEYLALDRNRSDHSPLVLKTVSRTFGLKPFRFFNSWLGREDFSVLVKEAMVNGVFEGAPDTLIMLKFKRLRSLISVWAIYCMEKECGERRILEEELGQLDVILEERQLTEEEVWSLEEIKRRLRELDVKAANYFPGLLVRGVWVSKPEIVKTVVLRFFRSKFSENVVVRPKFICDGLKKIDNLEAERLIQQFTVPEIKDAMFGCGADKAPGPDGFNFRFIRSFWELFQNDFNELMSHFHDVGRFSAGVGSSFITMIPKVGDPVELSDFRPINLIGIISKVVSKVLANRLKTVMGKVVSETQSAFLTGRNILDGPLMVNEVIAWAKKRGKNVFIQS
ncbi:uncharacterized protein LOC110893498 [Helianthus annuus]|uniref:uncharacterized protein LOC110893498 n=1 Tax=Helianthus annuus TaxID=4232 RepID=UPI000B904C68|nr:uncharacterized protein LOC110893498 [Helianthus annuus]